MKIDGKKDVTEKVSFSEGAIRTNFEASSRKREKGKKGVTVGVFSWNVERNALSSFEDVGNFSQVSKGFDLKEFFLSHFCELSQILDWPFLSKPRQTKRILLLTNLRVSGTRFGTYSPAYFNRPVLTKPNLT